MYRQTGFCRFLGFFGLWKINNLPVFSAPWPFDSVPGHHLNSSEINSYWLVLGCVPPNGRTTLPKLFPRADLREFCFASTLGANSEWSGESAHASRLGA